MRYVRWAGLILLLTATVALAAFPMLFDRQPFSYLGTQSLWYLFAGLLVMARRPWHQTGWFLMMLGLGLALTSLPPTPVDLDSRWYPWLSWVNGTWGGSFAYTALAALLVSFPDGLGRRSLRDRRIGRAIVAVMGAVTLLAATSNPVAGTLEDGSPGRFFDNPLGLRLIPRSVSDFLYVPILMLISGCVVWLWRRQRHLHGEERRRYTLVLYAFAVLAVSLLIGISLSDVTDKAWLGAVVAWMALPAAFAYAIIRRGLYGVDRLVSRTIEYGLLGAVVATVYAVPVVLLPRLLGESNQVVVAGSTLAAAAVFNPARRRIQQAVDHRFNRARYDAERELAALSSRLEGAVALPVLNEDLTLVIDRTVSPEFSAVWLREAT